MPFARYGTQALIDIVTARIGDKLVAPKALEYVAKKVSKVDGDAREAIQLVRKAIELYKSKQTADTLGAIHTNGTGVGEAEAPRPAPVVTLRDVLAAIRESKDSHADTIKSLPRKAQIVLSIAVTILRIFPDCSTYEVQNIKKHCSVVIEAEFGDDSSLQLDDFLQLVETLHDAGLLRQDSTAISAGETKVSKLRRPVHLGVQLEDVEAALDKTMAEYPWYSKLVERVQKCGRPGMNSGRSH